MIRKNRIKKVTAAFALALLTVLPATGQHYIGVRGGYGVGHARFYPYQEEKMVWGMYSAGIAWKYYSSEKYLGGVAAEVEYVRKAHEYRIVTDGQITDTTYRRTINTVQIPLIWQPHINVMNNRARVFLNLGIAAQYNFPVSQVDSLLRGEVYYREKYESVLVRDNPFGYGLIGGLGINIAMERWEFTVEGRYYFGYGDILRHTDRYPGNPRRSPMDNIMLSTGFFYRLTDGTHNPPQSRRQRKREERKIERQMMEALEDRQRRQEQQEREALEEQARAAGLQRAEPPPVETERIEAQETEIQESAIRRTRTEVKETEIRRVETRQKAETEKDIRKD